MVKVEVTDPVELEDVMAMVTEVALPPNVFPLIVMGVRPHVFPLLLLKETVG